MGKKVPGPLRIYMLLKDSPLKISEKLSPPKNTPLQNSAAPPPSNFKGVHILISVV